MTAMRYITSDTATAVLTRHVPQQMIQEIWIRLGGVWISQQLDDREGGRDFH